MLFEFCISSNCGKWFLACRELSYLEDALIEEHQNIDTVRVLVTKFGIPFLGLDLKY